VASWTLSVPVKKDSFAERIWRLRKRQHRIDAVLRATGEGGCALEFTMNGRRLTVRNCVSRAHAVKAATEQRKELERAGWTTHW
jgi:hypothetical protein